MAARRFELLPKLNDSDRKMYLEEESERYRVRINKLENEINSPLSKSERILMGISLVTLGILTGYCISSDIFSNNGDDQRLPEELRIYDSNKDGKISGIESELMLRDYKR